MKTIHELLDDMGTVIPVPDEHRMGSPLLYELYGSEWVELAHLGGHSDVYDLLDDYSASNKKRNLDTMPSAFALLTTGWASPLNEVGDVEGRPSEHPLRRRVALFMVSAVNGRQASRIVFADDVANPVDDIEGGASGSLSEAVDTSSVYLWGRRFVEGIVSLVEESGEGGSDCLQARARRVARLVEAV